VEGCYGVRPAHTDEDRGGYRRGGRSFVAGEPERFRRLLTEQVRVADLLEARDAGGADIVRRVSGPNASSI
jgi:hypothetical protein